MWKALSILIVILGFGLDDMKAQNPRGAGANAGLCPLYIPNAFTPNGDNINDKFELRISEDCEVLKFSMQIFDRWGRMVYQTESISVDQAWNGKSENKDLEKGVYLYKIQAELLNYNNRKAKPIKITKQGSVVLIR